MSFFNKILNRCFETNDKHYTGDPDPLPQVDGPVPGVTRTVSKKGVSLKIQWGQNSGSDQAVEPSKTKEVKEYK